MTAWRGGGSDLVLLGRCPKCRRPMAQPSASEAGPGVLVNYDCPGCGLRFAVLTRPPPAGGDA